MSEIVYKITNYLHGKHLGLSGIMTYEPGKWVESEYGPILAFNSLQNARALSLLGQYIWLAEAEDVFPVGVVLSHADTATLETIKKFWHSVYKSDFDVTLAPRGTVGCRRIRLVKVVYEEKDNFGDDCS
ncbi:MAG: hypothetical protein DSY80_07715 [Desulfocapsa sp.]|nr:MAG: hypothetical protein DSY80_07715 [Desulfocapsa sp.]